MLIIIFSIAFSSFLAFAFYNLLKVSGIKSLIIGGVSFVSLLIISSIAVITAGHVGVQSTFGEVNMTPITEGMHIVNPLSLIKSVDVRLASGNITGQSAGTKDLQQVHTDININYRLDPAKTPYILKEFGLNVDTKVLAPSASEAFKSVTGHYTSEELITKRDEVSEAILSHLRVKVAPYSITINSISLVNFAFSAEYQKAIEAKVISSQMTAKAEQDLNRIKIEAQQSIAKAKGEAEAIQIQVAAINSQGGENYVRLKSLEKWDGKLPTMMTGATPFINVK